MNNRLSPWLLVITIILSGFISADANAAKLLSPLFAEKPSSAIRLAPNGMHYLIAVSSKDTKKLTLYDSQTRKAVNEIDLSAVFDSDSIPMTLQWLDNQYLALTLIDKTEVESTLFERNVQTKFMIVDMLSSKEKPIIYQVTTEGFLVEPAPQEDKVFYYSRTGHKSKVYKIEIPKLLKVGQKRSKITRVDGGQFVAKNVVAEAEGFARRWFFEDSGQPNAVLLYTRDGMELAVYQDEIDDADLQSNDETEDVEKHNGRTVVSDKPKRKAKTIKTWSEKDFKDDNSDENSEPLFLPMDQSSEANVFYSINVNEDKLLNLYLVNYETGEHELVFASPGLSIQDVIFSADKEAIGVVVVDQGLYTELYFDGQPKQSNQDVLEIETAASLNNDIKLIYSEAHNQGGKYLISVKDGAKHEVLDLYPAIPEILPSSQIRATVKVDDIDVPYLLNLPENTSKANAVPLILMPHGGPFDVYDSPYFDPITQFFNANGYAVLRVNFRGSGGYGIEHRDAGKKQWGGKMLDDILGALTAVQQRDDIDAQRTCVLGMSYGGYAALSLSLKHPELFTCTVSVSGVTDMNLFTRHSRISPAQHKWLKEFVGDIDKEYDSLVEISPLYQMHNLQTPLLLVHGAKDTTVSVEHAWRSKLILDKAGIPFTWSLYEEADHHFNEEGQNEQLFAELLNFVNAHLLQNE